MARTARHPDAIRSDELVIVIVLRVVHEALAIPSLASGFVEIRIREQPETENAGRLSIDFFINARWFGFGWFVQPKAIFVRLRRSPEAGLIDQPESLEALSAWILAIVERLK